MGDRIATEPFSCLQTDVVRSSSATDSQRSSLWLSHKTAHHERAQPPTAMGLLGVRLEFRMVVGGGTGTGIGLGALAQRGDGLVLLLDQQGWV